MRTSARLFVSPILALCLAVLLGGGLTPATAGPLDDDATAKSAAFSTDSAKDAKPVASTATSGLTERERMLLDRVEQLERRVAELEAGHQPAIAVAASATTNSGSPALLTIAATPASPGSAAPANSVTNNNADVSGSTTPVSTSVAAQTADQSKKAPPSDPFAFADFTWLNGNPRTKDIPLDTKFFTPEIRSDVDYIYDFRHPKDDTISGSSEVFRAGEVQLTQLGVGGDFHYDNVRARLMTQFGLYSETTPRNDASPARGQWNLGDAYRYISEAYGGYHFNVMHGINVDAGIFMSYVGLFSYYQFDNWAYQPSYVSSNTPWFFNGVRIQVFPSDKLKIEPWIINGWQSYGKFNKAPGVGMQVLWRPNGSLSLLSNNYWGTDTLGNPDRKRIHTDDSIQVKYYDMPSKALD